VAYNILVSATNYLVTATSIATTVNVTAPATPSFAITTTNQIVNLSTYLTTTSIYVNAVELKVDDFDNYYKGDWTSGATYYRGDIVNYAYSLYTCSTGTLTTLTSVIAPPQDLGNAGTPDSVGNYANGMWRRVVWNEAPRDHLTVTNNLLAGNLNVVNTATISKELNVIRDLSVGRNASISGSLTVGPASSNGGLSVKGPLYIDGISEFVGTATFDSTVLMPYADLTARNITSSQRVTANELVVNTTSTFNGLITANSTSTFNQRAIFNNGITADNITATNRIVADNLTVNQNINTDYIAGRHGNFSILEVHETGSTINGIFELNGLVYPLNQGLTGQVLSTDGVGSALWVNLSDLNYWNLSTDLTTNGHNIITGVNASTHIRNNISILPGNDSTRSSINLTDDGRVVSLVSNYHDDHPTQVPEIDLYSDGIINIVSGYNLNGVYADGSGILLEAKKGDTQHYSSIEIGHNRVLTNETKNINSIVYSVTSSTYNNGSDYWYDGYHEFKGGNIKLSSPGFGIQFPDGSIQYSSSQGSTGTYVLPTASASTLGGIKVGNGLSIDGSGVLSATGGGGGGSVNGVRGNAPLYASTDAYGTATVYLNVGSNLSVDERGYLNAFAGSSTSYVSLGQDMLTNGYRIKSSNHSEPGFITITDYGITIDSYSYDSGRAYDQNIITTASSKVYINGLRGVDIIAGHGDGIHPATSQVNSIADYTRLGTDNNHSDLGVNRIRNYQFSGPPLFPNGIQFDDQTVQITAYDDGRFNFGNITPPFNRQSWQDLITQLLGSQGTINTPNTGHWTFGPIII
jgi:hypothetical protein